jgi:uncharacterized DUF497 family protein
MYNYPYNQPMRYTCDPKKRATNLKKHGYNFEDAPQVIESERTVTFEDHYPGDVARGELKGSGSFN